MMHENIGTNQALAASRVGACWCQSEGRPPLIEYFLEATCDTELAGKHYRRGYQRSPIFRWNFLQMLARCSAGSGFHVLGPLTAADGKSQGMCRKHYLDFVFVAIITILSRRRVTVNSLKTPLKLAKSRVQKTGLFPSTEVFTARLR
jgi:hypothetical protein